MNPVDNYLYSLNEGKVWDKVKKVWRDNKGKIIGTVVAGAAAYGAYKGAKAMGGSIKDTVDKYQATQLAKEKTKQDKIKAKADAKEARKKDLAKSVETQNAEYRKKYSKKTSSKLTYDQYGKKLPSKSKPKPLITTDGKEKRKIKQTNADNVKTSTLRATRIRKEKEARNKSLSSINK